MIEDKKTLRKKLKRRIEEKRSEELSKKCVSNLIERLETLSFSSAFIFLSDRLEPDTDKVINWLFENGKKVLVPIMIDKKMFLTRIEKGDEFIPNKMNIKEPKIIRIEHASDIVVVPLLGFDENLDRLGRGGGNYDKYLAEFEGLKIGYAFSFQQERFKVEKYDVTLDEIVTDKGVKVRI